MLFYFIYETYTNHRKANIIDLLKEKKIDYKFYETSQNKGQFATYKNVVWTQYAMPGTPEQNGTTKR